MQWSGLYLDAIYIESRGGSFSKTLFYIHCGPSPLKSAEGAPLDFQHCKVEEADHQMKCSFDPTLELLALEYKVAGKVHRSFFAQSSH